MAQNLQRIREALAAHLEGMCDDCLSKISGVVPRQTVYAICSAQSRIGATTIKFDVPWSFPLRRI
jgi:hypothetical protein